MNDTDRYPRKQERSGKCSLETLTKTRRARWAEEWKIETIEV